MSERVSRKKQNYERFAKANEIRIERNHLKKEYDLMYRKSRYLKFSIIIRSLVLLISVYLFFFDEYYFYQKSTSVVSCELEEKHVSSKRGSSYTELYAHIVATDNSEINLILSRNGNNFENFRIGDTINIEHTFFGKASYVSKNDGKYYYITEGHQRSSMFFMFAGIVAILSLFMTGGYDISTRYFVKFSDIASAAALLLYYYF